MSVTVFNRARLAVTGMALLSLAAAAIAAPVSTVIATGLDNPKQPAVGPDGYIYVAESGHVSPTGTVIGGYPTALNGVVAQVSPAGQVTPWLSGLPSRFYQGDSVGPSGIAFWNNDLYVAQGLSDQVNSPSGHLVSAPVLKVTSNQRLRSFTSFDAISIDPTNTGAGLDVDPYGAAVGSDGLLYVSDGAENGVWQVQPNGDTRMYVQIPGNPVATGLAAMPAASALARGNNRRPASLVLCLFGNGMSGFSNGQVVVVSDGSYRTLVPPGVINMPIGAAYSPKGQLYILQFAVAAPAGQPGPPFLPGTGAIWSVSASGQATRVLGGLSYPTGMTFAPDGTAYVSNNGTSGSTPSSPGGPTGQLVKVTGL